MEPLPDFSFPFLDDENIRKFTIEFSYISYEDCDHNLVAMRLLKNANGLYGIDSIKSNRSVSLRSFDNISKLKDSKWRPWPEIVAEIRLNVASEHFYDSDSNMASVDVDTIEQYVCAVEKFNSAMLF